MRVEEFKTLLKTNSDDIQICQTVLMSSHVWLLEEKGHQHPHRVYDTIKLFFSKHLKVSTNDIAIVGSAKTGYSLSPWKNFKPFDHEISDIDIILVSPRRFQEFWDELLKFFYGAGTFVDESNFADVFRKFITLDRKLNYPSDKMRDWHQTMDTLKSSFYTNFDISNPIKYRIYESWDAANAYHANGISKLRSKIRAAKDA